MNTYSRQSRWFLVQAHDFSHIQILQSNSSSFNILAHGKEKNIKKEFLYNSLDHSRSHPVRHYLFFSSTAAKHALSSLLSQVFPWDTMVMCLCYAVFLAMILTQAIQTLDCQNPLNFTRTHTKVSQFSPSVFIIYYLGVFVLAS